MQEGGPVSTWIALFVAVIETLGILAAIFFMVSIRKKINNKKISVSEG